MCGYEFFTLRTIKVDAVLRAAQVFDHRTKTAAVFRGSLSIAYNARTAGELESSAMSPKRS
jgi:hypothetical protein